LRGRGDYSTEINSEVDYAKRLEKKIDHLEKSLVHATPTVSRGASMAGRALGTMLGQGDLGALAGEQLSKLFGYGDYSTKIQGNSLMAGVAGNAVPKFQGDGKRGVRLTEREFIGNVLSGAVVSGSSVFSNTSYPLVPTDANTFPWLSKMAGLFDQWEAHGIVFEFHTTSSTFNGTSQALGAVIMATDYDPLDPAYVSKQIMENADYACSGVPSANLLHGIECDPKERPLEVMFTTLRAATPSFSSLGNFQIATQGCSTAGTTLGELWVSYDITFYKKQLISSVVDTSYLDFGGNTTAGGPLLLSTDIYVQKGITILPVVGTGTRLIFPPSQGSGNFLYTLHNTSYGAGDQTPPVVTNGTITSIADSNNVAATPVISTGVINITAAGASVLFGLKNVTNSRVSFTLEEVVSGTRVV
jgi:hypothetical protein